MAVKGGGKGGGGGGCGCKGCGGLVMIFCHDGSGGRGGGLGFGVGCGCYSIFECGGGGDCEFSCKGCGKGCEGNMVVSFAVRVINVRLSRVLVRCLTPIDYSSVLVCCYKTAIV